MSDPLKIYTDYLTQDKRNLQKCQQKQKRFFIFRILSFSAIILSLVYLPFNLALIFASILLVLFLSIVRKSILTEKEEKLLTRLIAITNAEIKAQDGSFGHFHEGNEFVDPRHPYSYDLDIFGGGSLFQFLNRTTTPLGRKKLASYLEATETDIEKLTKRQQAVTELERDLRWRHLFAAQGDLNNEKDLKLLEQFSEKDHLRNTKRVKVAITIIPIIAIVCLILVFTGLVNWSILLLLAAFNISILTFSKKTINKYYLHFGNQTKILQQYQTLLKLIEERNFETPDLVALKKNLSSKTLPASQIIQKLQSYLARFDYRGNILFIVFADPLFLWDLICVYKLNNWHLKYHRELQKWFDVIATIDALFSLANFNYNHSDFAIPVFTDHDFFIDGEQMAHPLIKKEVRIGNNFSMIGKSQLIILTGANMAGKSTFLRTVGVNMILAMNGCRCCAEKFRMKPVHLYTNMRTTDNLLKAESYFHAELLRLQAILNQIKSGVETLVLIDEMLKGTNSDDKLEGSRALTRHLIKLEANGIISTHDLKLTQLQHEYPANIHPLCFEITIENDNLVFDYKLRPGVTQTMNAIFLMRKMGISTE
jgi:hypothetical protein